MTRPPDETPVCFARACRMAARALTRHYNARLRDAGLQVTQLSLLVALRQGADRTLNDLAERMALERTTLLRNLDALTRAGLIQAAVAGPGRARRYHLTPEGEAALARALPLWREAQDALSTALGEDASDMRAMLVALRRAAEAAGGAPPSGGERP